MTQMYNGIIVAEIALKLPYNSYIMAHIVDQSGAHK